MNWRALVLSVMKVPHDPEPPFGAPPRIFRAANNYLTLLIVRWALAQVALLIPLVAFTVMMPMLESARAPGAATTVLWLIELFAWVSFIAQFIFGWAMLRLTYELRWYMLTDRAIRIREGIATVREKTIALANVQNIEIKQGPLQRLLGIADVEVKTAGGGATGAAGKGQQHREPLHVAFFRGVDNAEEIRDLVREGVRRQKDSGLGDPDDHRQETAHDTNAFAAANELLREARKLRAVVEHQS